MDTLAIRLAIVAGAALTAFLGLTAPVARAPLFRPPNAAVESLADTVENDIHSNGLERPVIRIGSRESWPTAIAVILHLYKCGIPISVEPDWLFLVGTQFAFPAAHQPSLWFGNGSLAHRPQTQRTLTPIGSADDVFVYFEKAG